MISNASPQFTAQRNLSDEVCELCYALGTEVREESDADVFNRVRGVVVHHWGLSSYRFLAKFTAPYIFLSVK